MSEFYRASDTQLWRRLSQEGRLLGESSGEIQIAI